MKKLLHLTVVIGCIFVALITNAVAADQVHYYHTDPAGTPLAMTDASGTVVWKADYKPFGEENTVTGTGANDRRFVGKEKDEETGLSYFVARYMDTQSGRFAAVDPIRAVDPESGKPNEELLLNPQRLNVYAYGLNNPYLFVDQDGKFVQYIIAPVLAGLFLASPANAPDYCYTPTVQSQSAAEFAGGVAMMETGGFIAVRTIGPALSKLTSGGVGKTGLNIGEHALERMSERGITTKMVEKALAKGTRYWDPKNQSVNYVLEKGFASGKSLLVAQNPASGQINTVIRGSNLVPKRFIPIN